MLFFIGDNMNRANANLQKTPSLILVMGLMLMVILPSVLNRASASKTEAQEGTSINRTGKVALQTSAIGCADVSFTQPAGSPVGAGTTPRSIAISDFNADGKLDLAVASSGSGTVNIFLGTGGGGFTQAGGSPISIGVGTNSRFLGLSDYNLDGKMDLAVVKRNSNHMVMLLGNGSGGFTQLATTIATGTQPNSVGAGDFDSDGKPDLVAVNNGSNNVTIQLNTCATSDPPTITATPVSRTEGSPSANSQVATVDDVQDAENTLAVTVNGGASATVSGVTVSGIRVSAAGVVTADVVAACGATTASFTLRVTDSSTLFTEATLTVTVTPNSAPTLGNYPTTTLPAGSGITVTPDAAPTNTARITVATSTSFNGTFAANPATGVVRVTDVQPAGTYPVTVRAFDSMGATFTRTFNLIVQTPAVSCATPSFSPAANVAAGDDACSVAVGDFNGDGKQDFAVTAAGVLGTDNRVFVRLGDGLGNFSGTTVLTVGTNPRLIAIGDYNKDGKQDLAIAITNSNIVSIRLGDGAGGFTGSMDVPTGSRPLSVAAGDFNEDGTLDFAAINGSNNNASIRLGGCTPNTAPTISAQAGLSRQQGSPASGSAIAMVGDDESGPGGVTVTVTTTNPSNGVRIQNIVNTNGTITANVSATCTATNATFTLQASDGSLATSATLSVAVTANSLPVLTYSNPTTLVGTSTTVNPATGPSDNGTFSVAFLNVSPNTFTGTISANTSTGIVMITNAAPVGAYTVNLRITDNCGAITNVSFTLNVTNTLTWNGSTSNNWNAATNWTPGFVPAAPNDVVIPASGVTNEPTLSTTAATVNNLTVAVGRTLTLSGQNMTVNGALSLSGGLIDTGANTLTLGTRATISRTSGQVMGNLKKQFGGAGSFTYAVGTANGYSPVDVPVIGGAGDLTVKAVQGNQPLLDSTRSLKRYWAMNGAGVTVNMVLHYLDPADIAGNESAYRLIRVEGGATFIYPDDCATGSPCVDPIANTATINSVSNFADWTVGESVGPTAVDLASFTAKGYDDGVFVEWKTGNEVSNLGFNIYREQGGQRWRVNSDIIAGSALKVGPGVTVRAGYSYGWWDQLSLSNQDVSYYLEDLDIDGHSTLHGPFKITTVSGKPPVASQAETLSRLSGGKVFTGPVALATQPGKSAGASSPAPFGLAGKAAVKMTIKDEGWYRVTQSELAAAGFDMRGNPRNLQLFVDGVEQPLLVVGESDNSFDASDALEFYATGQNTLSSDAHIYWLAAGTQPGKRIGLTGTSGKPGGGQSFLQTIERRERLVYFSGLLNGDTENFFGSVIASQPVEQPLALPHVDTNAAGGAELEIALQGVTDLSGTVDHTVSVALNGVIIGRVVFDGREHKVERFSIYRSYLREGDNQITLMSEGGASDISPVDYIRVSYWRRYVADNDALRLSASSGNGATQTIEGFSTPLIRVFDTTDSNAVTEIAGLIEGKAQNYSVTVSVKGPNRTVLAVSDAQIKRPAAIALNQISVLRNPVQGADLVILTQRKFFASLAPLVTLRQSQSMSVSLVDIEDVYDEFSYGEKTAQAVKDFLAYTQSSWKKKPRFVLLGGDACFDAKNYLGFGDFDLVPTRLIDMTLMETASDDWFADFDDDGMAEVAIGRLPFRTTGEAAAMVAKLTADRCRWDEDGQSRRLVSIRADDLLEWLLLRPGCR